MDVPALIDTEVLLAKLASDLAVVFIIVRLIYYPRKHDKEYLFTFVMFNLLVFLVVYFMHTLQLSVGFAFGMFALFAILRYRTITIPIKEMTYLFTVIVVAIINSLNASELGISLLVVSNLMIIVTIFFLENVWERTPQGFKLIIYEKIDNIKAQNHPVLLDDLRERTGLDITHLDIDNINFSTNTATIKIYYNLRDSEGVRRVIEKN
jgi:hypothetical protein